MKPDPLSGDLPILTFDIDWAPSWVIEGIAYKLIEADVRSTWFATHEVEALALLRERPDLFEIGIHPNFQKGSTQGIDEFSILQWCMDLVPEARSVRTHALMQSTPLLDLIMELTPIRTDVSLYLPRAVGLDLIAHERPHGTMIRLPYVWEDDLEMGVKQPEWSMGSILGRGPGLNIFDFHPLHVLLNAVDLDSYTSVKRFLHDPIQVSPKVLRGLQREGDGPGTLLDEIIAFLHASGGSYRVRDLMDSTTSSEVVPH